jgi:hypothetical protein
MGEFSSKHVPRRGISAIAGGCEVLVQFLLCAACLFALVMNGAQPGKRTVAAIQEPPRASQPVSQEGAVVAATVGSVTARSANGYTQTYLVTPDTTVIAHGSGQQGTAAPHFTVNDRVVILGTIRGGRLFATTVAYRDAGNGAGTPMDYVEGQLVSPVTGH